MTRTELLNRLSQLIQQIKKSHPTRVAIDGVDNAGKTTLANSLAKKLIDTGRSIIRASIDGFHQPKEKRYRRGHLSPEGYYSDSFDHDSMKQQLLIPLGSGGNFFYTTAVFDFRTDAPRTEPAKLASNNAILIFDGVFLFRPELNEHWDFRIFLHIDFDTVIERAILRDRSLFGDDQTTVERYTKRYIPGQQMYLQRVRPNLIADIVIDNTDPNYPKILKEMP
jgi:uridine kinase